MSASVAEAKAAVSIVAIISETLPLIRDGQLWRSRCPWHGERTASFTVFAEPSPGHYHCFGCGAHGDVAARSPTLAAARRVWADALRARGTIVEAYLDGRGLSLPDDHPQCQRGPRDRTGCAIIAPAMVCLMTDPVSGAPTGVHRTFLTSSGAKAPPINHADRVLPSKSILGRWGSIRVPPPNETRGAFAISEGLENGMSAQILLEWEWGPIWAAGCRASIAAFPVLHWASSLTIFADGDEVGIQSARTCESRWREAARHVEVRIPPPGHDWNSALTQRGR